MSSVSYRWKNPVAGQKRQPSNWLMIRQIPGRGTGPLWLASSPVNGMESVLYFPPQSLVQNAALLDEWRQSCSGLVESLDPPFQFVRQLSMTSVEWPFLEIERVEGVALKQLYRSSSPTTMPLSQLKGWLQPVCSALCRAHENGRVHGYLQSDCWKVDGDGKIRILGFEWVAKTLDFERRSGGALKTDPALAFLSPQVLGGATPSVTDDVYSFGAMLYDVLTSQAPFLGKRLRQQINRTKPEPVRVRLEQLGLDSGSVPEALDQAILRCLAKEPQNRYPSLQEFWQSAFDGGRSGSRRRVSYERLRRNLRPGIGGQSVELADGGGAKDPEKASRHGRSERSRRGGFRSAERSSKPSRRTAVYSLALFLVVAVAALIDRSGILSDGLRPSRDDETGNVGRLSSTNAAKSARIDGSLGNGPDRLIPTLPEFGSLSVVTDPPGVIAEIWFTDREVPEEQVTPTVFSRLPVGEIELRLAGTGYAGTNIFTTIEAGQTNRLELTLPIKAGQVSVVSRPSNARYSIVRDGLEFRSGQTPDRFQFQAGDYDLTYSLGSLESTVSLNVVANRENTASEAFEVGNLRVVTPTDDAEVFVDGKFEGLTPVTVLHLSLDAHEVVVKAKKFLDYSETVTITGGAELYMDPTLVPRPFPDLAQAWNNSLGMPFLPFGDAGVLGAAYELTQGVFQRFVTEGEGDEAVIAIWDSVSGVGSDPSELPAVGVSYVDAEAFCAWLTNYERDLGWLGPDQVYRVPTIAEWDRMVGLNGADDVGAIDNQSYPWGDWPPSALSGNYASFSDLDEDESVVVADPFPELAGVGRLLANEKGFFDLGGNVREWCRAEADGSGDRQWVRGGSWRESDPVRLASAFREALPVTTRESDIGLRLVLARSSE